MPICGRVIPAGSDGAAGRAGVASHAISLMRSSANAATPTAVILCPNVLLGDDDVSELMQAPLDDPFVLRNTSSCQQVKITQWL
jgi:hypothetical protein